MRFVTLFFLATLAEGNIYLHSPRGSNNRIFERSAQNSNNARLFHSNNNRRGGYNVGDSTASPSGSKESQQYSMQYFQSGSETGGDSILTVEWTNQKGCGVDEDGEKLHNCEFVIQTYCQTDEVETGSEPPNDSFTIRNGNSDKKMVFKRFGAPEDPQGKCYIDGPNRDLQHYAGYLFGNRDYILACRNRCNARGYTYAGVQYSYQCFCDNDFGDYGEAPQSECYRRCWDRTRPRNKCGGPWRNNIYLADISGSKTAYDYDEDGTKTDFWEGSRNDYYYFSEGPKTDEYYRYFNDTNVTDVDLLNLDDANTELNDENLDEYLVEDLIREYKENFNNSINETEPGTGEPAAPPPAPVDPVPPQPPGGPNEPDEPDGFLCSLIQTLLNFFGLGDSSARSLLQLPQVVENEYDGYDIDRNLQSPQIVENNDNTDEPDIYNAHRSLQAESNETHAAKEEREKISSNNDIGVHEPWVFFERCPKALGTRYGMECKEERNNYPYESISPWTDIAYLSDSETCPDNIKDQNTRPYSECVEFYNATLRRHKSMYKTSAECIDNGGQWESFYKVGHIRTDITTELACLGLNTGTKRHVWGRPMIWKDLSNDILSAKACIVLPAEVKCMKAPATREGYLGNVDGERHTPRFEWILPNHNEDKRCVMRIRYILSHDQEPVTAKNSVSYTDGTDGVTIAQAPAQVIYQDRSHVFKLLQRPTEIAQNLTIHNLVVRGKRGNIVQTFPAVEYDFVPDRLNITEGDAIHVQWTGSNTHNNRRPGGDGQTGDAGEGTGGTDRNNFAQLINRKANFPAPSHKQTLFKNADWIWSSHDKGAPENKAFNLALSMATVGFYRCKNAGECSKPVLGGAGLNDQLNNADASYFGNIFAPAKGEYHYKCTRNDNFSNRHQKGTITVL